MRADVTWSPLDARWYQESPALAGNFAGIPVSPDTAQRVSAVFACNSLIAESLASLPCILYRRRSDGGKERATDHPLYRVVRRRPNDWMTAMDFFGFGQGHVGLRGNVIAEIQEGRDGIQLIPYHPNRVTIEQLSSGRLRYQVRDPKGGPTRTLLQDEVLHVRDLPMDGFSGVARVALAREAIGVAAAGEAFVGGFFRNDATGRLVLSHPGPGVPDKDKREQFKQEVRTQWSGYKNRGVPMILYGGMTATEVGLPDDSGFIIDPRKFQVADIARFWRVPLFMIGLEEKSTSWGTGIEQQKQGFVDFTLRAWTTRWEQALSRALLSEDEQEEYFFEFLMADLLRGDLKSRTDALAIQRDRGVISPNEWRVIENMNPRPGGDAYQEAGAGAAAADPARAAARPMPPAEDTEDDAEDVAARLPTRATRMEPLLADAAGRLARAEIEEVVARGAKAQEDGARFAAWVATYYGADSPTRARIARTLQPIADAFGLDAMAVQLTADRLALAATRTLGAHGVPAGWAEARKAEVALIVEETFQAAARLAPAA